MIQTRRSEGAALFESDSRFTGDMQERFFEWLKDTAVDLERLFWSTEVANWFRSGSMWMAGDYRGTIETRDDRLAVLDDILTVVPAGTSADSASAEYDVCLSFAGEQRPYVERVAAALRTADVRVFYDKYEQVDLWGKDLYEHLNQVYRDRARFCIIFISKDYAAKQWTTHERRSAQARAFRENRVYILPARFDETELPGMNETVGYIDLRTVTPEQFADLVVQKLRGRSDPLPVDMPAAPQLPAVAAAKRENGMALIAEWKRLDLNITGEHHDYRLLVDIHNVGTQKIDDWRVQLWFPRAFLKDPPDGSATHVLFNDYDGNHPEQERRMYRGDRVHVFDVDYFVEHSNWPASPFLPETLRRLWIVRIKVCAHDMEPWEIEIPMAGLQNF